MAVHSKKSVISEAFLVDISIVIKPVRQGLLGDRPELILKNLFFYVVHIHFFRFSAIFF